MARKIPTHLSPESKKLWRKIAASYAGIEGDASGEKILQSLCECLDRLTAISEQIGREGLTVPGSQGQPRAHPLLASETEHRRMVLAHYRALRLEPEE